MLESLALVTNSWNDQFWAHLAVLHVSADFKVISALQPITLVKLILADHEQVPTDSS